MQLTGTVKKVHETETKGNFTFRKLWITTDGNTPYPQTIELQCNKPELLNSLQPGQEVTCHINLRGREWEKDGKVTVFHTLQVWKVEAAQATQPQYAQNIQAAGNTNVQHGNPYGYDLTPSNEQDTLPF